MAMIAVPLPAASTAFKQDRWDTGSANYPLSRPDPKSVALPSIRQAIPELRLAMSPASQGRPHSNHHPQSWTPSGPTSSTEYIHSPTNKRIRISNEEENESLNSHQVPRLYPRAERPTSGHKSPISHRPPTADDSWRSQAPAHYKLPVSVSPEFSHREHRPNLNSYPPPPGLERSHDALYTEEFGASQRLESQHHNQASRSPVFGSQSYEYSGRYNSMSASSTRSEERSPFAPSRYSMSQHDGGRYNDMGVMSGDTKQRKRRGNLPKETTDKLRAWFVTHLQHPYPTEDEKQDLMRQTGLQMNQISNWFINARRRQLPAMINNARAETDIMHSRAAPDGASIGGADRSDLEFSGVEGDTSYDASPYMHSVVSRD
ncbi:hypothetical protein NQ176_g6275 [Zarea fungicola]|uniref:Uncharacterized protein n=1 Tax=Zarea fungicola TaxID=93591 RepID=A0ACC1N527_9HYPO|nr:hypothetical protein NQ176_g6275 [Lecanicillium fungicola]